MPLLCSRTLTQGMLGIVLLILANSVTASHDDKVFRIGVEDHAYYPLYAFGDPKADAGVIESILERFAAKHDLKFEYVALPINRFEHWYEQEHIDFRIPDNPAWDASASGLLTYSEPVLHLNESTVVLKENRSLTLNQFERLGTLYGFTPSKHWQPRIESGELELLTDSSIKMLVRMLYNGVVQGLDLDKAVVCYYASQLGYDTEALTVATNIEGGQIGYRMSTQKYPELLAKFNRFVARYDSQIETLLKSKGVMAASPSHQ